MVVPPPDDMDERVRLATLLRAARESAGITQVDLSQQLGQPQSFVSKYETGERRLEFTEVRSICHALNVPFGEFAEGFDTP